MTREQKTDNIILFTLALCGTLIHILLSSGSSKSGWSSNADQNDRENEGEATNELFLRSLRVDE